MTKEEALKILKDCRRRGFDRTTYYVDEYHTARDMAIRALEEQETVTEFADRCRECGAKYGKLLKQEPCEDAISRQAVLDLMRSLTRWCVKSEDGKFENVGLLYDDVMFGIDRLPSVTPIQRWIPVSERLPKTFSYVYCTCHSLIDDREDWVVETVYIPQLSNSPYSDWGNIPILNWGEAEVVAWMYRDIQEPYKAERSGEE